MKPLHFILVSLLGSNSLVFGQSDANNFNLQPPPGRRALNTCNFTSSCSFWRNVGGGDVAWRIGQDEVAADVANAEAGSYLISDGLGLAKLRTADFINASRAICISFLYRLTGNANISLHYTTNGPDKSEKYVWHQQGSTSWTLQTSQVTMGNLDSVKLVLNGWTDGGNEASVSVTEISVFNSNCYRVDPNTGDTLISYEGESRLIGVGITQWETVIPYTIGWSGFTGAQAVNITRVLNAIMERTCLDFRYRTNEENFVQFVKGSWDCYSDFGKIGGRQQVQLGSNCLTLDMIFHTIGHVLGLRHEHIRPDRDSHIRVNQANIAANATSLYVKKTRADFDSRYLAVPYDTRSVMHFGKFDNGRQPGLPVLEDLRNPRAGLGNKDGPTPSDYQKLNAIYCNGVTKNPLTTATTRRVATTTTRRSSGNSEDNRPCTTLQEVNGQSFGILANYIRTDGYYRGGESCKTRIRVETGKVIRFNITILDIKLSRNCVEDSLTIYDGSNTDAGALVVTCGTTKPPRAFVTSSNFGFVVFSTLTSGGGSGYRLVWEAVDQSSNDNDVPSLDLSPVDCNFETTLCGWTEISTPQSGNLYRWSTKKLTSIQNDHTRGTTTGKYLAVDISTARSTNNRAIVRSLPISRESGFMCLQFWIQMSDLSQQQQIGDLEVLANYQTNGNNLTLWTTQDLDSAARSRIYRSWTKVLVSVEDVPLNYRLMFRATPRLNKQGGIAIDDLVLIQDSCKGSGDGSGASEMPSQTTPFDCGFEANLCNWQNSASSTFNWARKAGVSNPISDFGVSQAVSGNYYLLAAGSSSLAKGSLARLETIRPIVLTSGYKCLQLVYNMYAKFGGRFRVLAVRSADLSEIVLFEAAGNKQNRWYLARIGLDGINFNYKIVVEAQSTGQDESDLAVDDVRFFSTICASLPAYNLPPAPRADSSDFETRSGGFQCDFDQNNMCPSEFNITTVNQGSRTGFNWRLASGSMMGSSGPKQDYTLKTAQGRFALTRVTEASMQGSTAQMKTRPFSNSEVNCISFWYFINSTSANPLQVLLEPGTAQLTSLAGLGSTSGVWRWARIPVRSNRPFTIHFRSLAGTVSSVAAFDDLNFYQSSTCSLTTGGNSRTLNENSPVSNSNLEQERRRRKKRAVFGSSCNFFTDACLWANSDNFQPTLGSSFDSGDFQPDDNFLMFSYQRFGGQSGSPRFNKTSANLTSPEMTDRQICLKFFYKINSWFRNTPTDALIVRLRSRWSNWSRTVGAFSASLSSPDSLDQWTEVSLSLFETSPFQIIFEASAGQSWSTNIGLDAVQVESTNCADA